MKQEIGKHTLLATLCRLTCLQCGLKCAKNRDHQKNHDCLTDHKCHHSCNFIEAHNNRLILSCSHKAGKVAQHMLVSLWGRLYSDGRRAYPHQRMAPFIIARGCKIVSEKVRTLGDRLKRIYTDGFIILGKITDQLIGRQVGGGSVLKILKSGIVSIKNVISLRLTNFKEIIPTAYTNSEESTVRYVTTMLNEILVRIFQYNGMNRDTKISHIYEKQYNLIDRRNCQKVCLKLIGHD